MTLNNKQIREITDYVFETKESMPDGIYVKMMELLKNAYTIAPPTSDFIYNESGYNAEGYDMNGYDRDEFNSDGYDRCGYDEDGYNKDGYNKDGYDQDGYDEYNYDKDGYDEDGADTDGFDRAGNNLFNLYGEEIGERNVELFEELYEKSPKIVDVCVNKHKLIRHIDDIRFARHVSSSPDKYYTFAIANGKVEWSIGMRSIHGCFAAASYTVILQDLCAEEEEEKRDFKYIFTRRVMWELAKFHERRIQRLCNASNMRFARLRVASRNNDIERIELEYKRQISIIYRIKS